MFKRLHGPTFRWQGEKLESPALIYVEDHHYNEQDQCFHLQLLLKNSACDSALHCVVFDHVLQHDEFLNNPIYYPALLAKETQQYLTNNIQPNWANKTNNFNFIINKPRPHRKLLLELIDKFSLTNFRHSLCWKNSPVSTVPVTNFQLGNEVVLDQGFKNGRSTNAEIYKKLLQKTVFEPTYVSLITEPAYYERETIVTEKTLSAIWGGTVPVWVGGWRIPDYMRSQGFDVFDDLVDHSYQNLDDPEQRCRVAVEANLSLLRNPTAVDPARLQHNLDLVQSNPWLGQVNSLTEIYPDLRRVWPT